MIPLRDYQEDIVERTRCSLKAGKKSPMICLSTGAGKTVIFSHIANNASERGKKVLVMAHRHSLITQCSDKLDTFGLEHGIIKAGYNEQLWHGSQVASVQTFVKRMDTIAWTPDLIITDEGHHALAETYMRIYKRFPNAIRLGFSATPIAPHGRALREVYDDLIIGPTFKELVNRGFLAKPRLFTPPPTEDFSQIDMVAGDYNQKQLGEFMRDKPKITGDAIDHFRKINPKGRPLVFTVDIAGTESTADRFREAGLNFVAVHGKMREDEISRRIKAMADGKIQGLVSCDLIGEGTDIPVADTVISLRPTKSIIVHKQQMGRGSRIAPGKTEFFILDCVDNCTYMGGPLDEMEWTLEGKTKRSKDTYEADPDEEIKQCPTCNEYIDPARSCKYCGHVFEVKMRKIQQVDGDLQERDPMENELLVRAAREAAALKRQEVGRAKTREELSRIAKERGYSRGWVYHQAKIKGIK